MEEPTEVVRLKAYRVDWCKVLVQTELAHSMSMAHRLLKQGAVSVDGVRTTHRDELVPHDANATTDTFVLRVGKKAKKVTITL